MLSEATESVLKFSLSRKAKNNGFHRELMSWLVSDQKLPSDGCRVLLVEHLPSGIYVDLYQLAMMEEWGGHQVLADSEINVEKPEFASQPHILYVFNNMQEDHKNGERFNFSIPVHMRYHRPSDGQDFASVSFPNPDVLLKCSDHRFAEEWRNVEAPCNSHNSSLCMWKQIPHRKPPEITFQVPVGKTEHQIAVIVVTLVVVIAGTVILIPAVVLSTNKPRTH